MRLAGKFAIVTGGSEGLGLAMAEALARVGGDLCIVGRNAKKLADAARHLGDSLKLSVSAGLATENGIDRHRPYAGGTGKHEFHLLLPQSEVSQTRPMSANVQAEQHRLPLLKVDQPCHCVLDGPDLEGQRMSASDAVDGIHQPLWTR